MDWQSSLDPKSINQPSSHDLELMSHHLAWSALGLNLDNRYDLFIPTDAFINQVSTDTLDNHPEVRSSILNHDQILHGLPWTIIPRLSTYGLRHIVLAIHFVMTLSQSRSYQHQGWYPEASNQYSYSSNVNIHTSFWPSNHRHETWSDH